MVSNTETPGTEGEKLQLMRGSRKFCQRGSNFDKVFFVCLFFYSKAVILLLIIPGFLLPKNVGVLVLCYNS